MWISVSLYIVCREDREESYLFWRNSKERSRWERTHQLLSVSVVCEEEAWSRSHGAGTFHVQLFKRHPNRNLSKERTGTSGPVRSVCRDEAPTSSSLGHVSPLTGAHGPCVDFLSNQKLHFLLPFFFFLSFFSNLDCGTNAIVYGIWLYTNLLSSVLIFNETLKFIKYIYWNATDVLKSYLVLSMKKEEEIILPQALKTSECSFLMKSSRKKWKIFSWNIWTSI